MAMTGRLIIHHSTRYYSRAGGQRCQAGANSPRRAVDEVLVLLLLQAALQWPRWESRGVRARCEAVDGLNSRTIYNGERVIGGQAEGREMD